MSHFLVIALIPQTGDVEEHVEKLLAPYSEQREVASHQEDCWCVGMKARNEIDNAINPKIETRRVSYREAHIDKAAVKWWHFSKEADALWNVYIADILAEQKTLRATHPLRDKPDPECGDCKGTGKVETTSNPNGYWDWYVIGGRWTGFLTDYDASKDTENYEVCFLCAGTGKRLNITCENGCNGCEGTGKKLKFPTELKNVGNVTPALDYLVRLKDDPKKNAPYAIVTPDGKWHQSGKMLMFGMSTDDLPDDLPKDEWQQRVVSLVADNQDTRAVVVDCHV